MITFIFFIILSLYGSLCCFFVLNFFRRRRLPSLVIAWLSLGWVGLIARELHWLGRDATSVMLSLALIGGIIGVLICWNAASQERWR